MDNDELRNGDNLSELDAFDELDEDELDEEDAGEEEPEEEETF